MRDPRHLDQDFRCHWNTSGCVLSGFEPLTHLPNNATITLLVKTFGPMPGAYSGPFPSKAEAFRWCTVAHKIPIGPSVFVDGRKIHISEHILKECNRFGREARITTCGERCLIIGGQTYGDLPDSEQGPLDILVIDVPNDRIVAHYRDAYTEDPP